MRYTARESRANHTVQSYPRTGLIRSDLAAIVHPPIILPMSGNMFTFIIVGTRYMGIVSGCKAANIAPWLGSFSRGGAWRDNDAAGLDAGSGRLRRNGNRRAPRDGDGVNTLASATH
jgi:hypothetical protein